MCIAVSSKITWDNNMRDQTLTIDVSGQPILKIVTQSNEGDLYGPLEIFRGSITHLTHDIWQRVFMTL